jgi:nucleotide-binding universal stress UspA family protein
MIAESRHRPIVVGSDGSATATVAVCRAAQLAEDRGSELHIVTAYSDWSAAQRREVEAMPEEFHWMASPGQMADQTARKAAQAARAVANITVETHTGYGDPTTVLIVVAQEVGADTIVVGNRGMHGAAGFLRGTVPNRLSHRAPCDLLIVDTAGRAA